MVSILSSHDMMRHLSIHIIIIILIVQTVLHIIESRQHCFVKNMANSFQISQFSKSFWQFLTLMSCFCSQSSSVHCLHCKVQNLEKYQVPAISQTLEMQIVELSWQPPLWIRKIKHTCSWEIPHFSIYSSALILTYPNWKFTSTPNAEIKE